MTPQIKAELYRSYVNIARKKYRDVAFQKEYETAIKNNLRLIDDFFVKKFGPDWRESVDQDDLQKAFRNEYYNSVRISVWRACQKIFGGTKFYSPVDARSTFAANRKQELGVHQARSDMGHQHISVTNKNYAPKNKAWKS